jgi:hypothetical protein
MLYLFILCVNCSTDINLSSELFALPKRLFRSVRALMRLLTLHKLFSLLIWAKSSAVLPWPLSLGCVFIRTLSVEGVASELSLTVMLVKFSLILWAFCIVGGVIALTVDAFWCGLFSQLAVPGEMVPSAFNTFGPCVTVGGCVPPFLTAVTLHKILLLKCRCQLTFVFRMNFILSSLSSV